MVTHSSILAWRIPRSLAGYSPWGHKESDTAEQLTLTLGGIEECSMILKHII